jgi:hypothetical protein
VEEKKKKKEKEEEKEKLDEEEKKEKKKNKKSKNRSWSWKRRRKKSRRRRTKRRRIRIKGGERGGSIMRRERRRSAATKGQQHSALSLLHSLRLSGCTQRTHLHTKCQYGGYATGWVPQESWFNSQQGQEHFPDWLCTTPLLFTLFCPQERDRHMTPTTHSYLKLTLRMNGASPPLHTSLYGMDMDTTLPLLCILATD